MIDKTRECQAVGDFLARILAREFGVETAFICVSTEEMPPEEAVNAEAPAPAQPVPAPSE